MLAVADSEHIIDFVFTEGQGHAELESFLEDIKERCPEITTLVTGKNLSFIFTTLLLNVQFSDNCCSDRNSFQNIWGDNIQVKLDEFHAKQVCTFFLFN